MKRALNLFLTTAAAITPVGIIISCSTSNNLVSRSDLFKPEGGQINGLQVDKYLNVVKALELKPDINLTDLTPQTLNQKLQKIEPKAYVEIIDGSTANGFLKLRISEKRDFQLSQQATDGTIELTINGFRTDLPAMFEYVFKPKELSPTNPNLNEKAWIENLLPIENNNTTTKKIAEVTSLTWKKILSDQIEVVLLNEETQTKQSQATKPVVSTLGELKEKGFNFNISAVEIAETNEVQFNINAQINHYVYNPQTGTWNVDVKNQVTIPQVASEKAKTKIPNENAAKQYVLDKTTFVEEELPKFYPSFVRALGEYNETIVTPEGSQLQPFTIKDILKNELIDKAANDGTSQNPILKTYFANKRLDLAINSRRIVADDYNGMLVLSVNLLIDGNDDWSVETELSSEGTNKKLAENLPAFRKNPNIWTLKQNSTLQTNLLKALKNNNDTKNIIDQFFSNKQTLLQNEVVINTNDFIGNQDLGQIYSYEETTSTDAQTNHEKLISKIKENFDQLKLFGQELVFEYPTTQTNKQAAAPAKPDLSKTTINFGVGLLVFQDNTFQIDLLETNFNDQKLGENKTKIVLEAITAENGTQKLKLLVKGQNTIVLPPNGEQEIREDFDLTVETEIDQALWNQASKTN